jgi:hypothetical protein
MDNLLHRVEALECHVRTLEAHTQTVERRLRGWRWLACSLIVLSLVSLGQSLSTAQEERLEERLQTLAPWLDDVKDTLRKLHDLLTHVTIATDDAGRLEIIFSGVNLRIVNGLGQTDCGPGPDGPEPIPNCPNGLGNLIVGYNERLFAHVRTGSHNVVVGPFHSFSRFGGVVVGRLNTISGDFSSVSGGTGNTASGLDSSVSGGSSNTASSFGDSVSGGNSNTASGANSSVSGGGNNTASGANSSVSGGPNNTASGVAASVSGGSDNTASGERSAVSGGFGNTASSLAASVSGGGSNTASGSGASVSGGSSRTAPGENDWVAGSLFEDE